MRVLSGKNEIEKRNEKEVINLEFADLLDLQLDKAINLQKEKNRANFVNELFNIFDIGVNAKKIIDSNLDYVVKFTPKLLKKMEEYDIQFLRDKLTGDLLPDLYDYTEKGIGGKVRLELKGIPTNQDFVNFNNSINNLIEQKRYEELSEEIKKLNVTVKRIERGQDNDRFAKVNAGRKHLLDALNFQGNEKEKER